MTTLPAHLPLPPLLLAGYRFHLQASEPIQLPAYAATTLRGGFGYAFKSMVCFQPDRRACQEGCRLAGACPYGYIFETQVPPGSEVLSGQEEIPRPFVLRAANTAPLLLQPGQDFTCELLLFGRGLNYFPYFFQALRQLGQSGLGARRGRFQVTRVDAIPLLPGQPAQPPPLYDSATELLQDTSLPAAAPALGEMMGGAAPAMLEIDFLTPARLKHAGDYAGPDVPFHVLVRALLRRISALSYFHGGQRWEIDYPGWIALAQQVELAEGEAHWRDRRRYSTRQEQSISLGGVEGQVTYRGEPAVLAAFLPLLRLGQWTHVGKGAVFGNGWYRLAPPAAVEE